MARKRASEAVTVRDLDEAGEVLGQVARLRRDIGGMEHALNEQIDALKAAHDAQAAPMRAQVEALESGLRAFAEREKERLFEARRSVDLPYGSMGWRASTELKPQPRKTWGQVLGRLEQLDFDEAVRVRKSVDKEVLEKWSDDQLQLVGARRVAKDVFWYEIDEAKLDGR